MPAWTPVPIPELGLVKPSSVNNNNSTLASVINALDTTNITCKYAPCDLVFVFGPGMTRASMLPHVNDGQWFIRGWSLEQTGFTGGDTATFALQVVTDTGTLVGTVDTSPAQTASTTLGRIDVTTATLAANQGLRVAVTAGVIPASCSVTVCVQTARVLRKSTEL